MAPDPYDGSYDPFNPQSLNRYTYAINSPLSYLDPSGLDCVTATGNGNILYNPGDCPGFHPNNEYYIPCDSCVDTSVAAVSGPTGTLVLKLLDGNNMGDGDAGYLMIPNFDYTPDTSSVSDYSIGINAVGGTYFLSGSSLGGGGGTPWYKTCTANAVLSGAGRIGIDAIGLIPEAEGVTKVFENEAGYQIARAVGNSAGYRGVVATQYGMKAVAQGKGAAAAISGAFGLGDTSAQGRISTGLTVAGFIPGLGQAAAIGSIIIDTYKTTKAISQCP
jgi:hypothetical protein